MAQARAGQGSVNREKRQQRGWFHFGEKKVFPTKSFSRRDFLIGVKKNIARGLYGRIYLDIDREASHILDPPAKV